VAEIIIDEQSTQLETGQVMIIPAHSANKVKANERFKMLSTIIKSGYEDVTL
jgi:quercetin dioxygenase-like cupin family protein